MWKLQDHRVGTWVFHTSPFALKAAELTFNVSDYTIQHLLGGHSYPELEDFNSLEKRANFPFVYGLPLCISVVCSEWNKEGFLCVWTWSAGSLCCRWLFLCPCVTCVIAPLPSQSLLQDASSAFQGLPRHQVIFPLIHSLTHLFIQKMSTYPVLGTENRYKREQNKHGPCLLGHIREFRL